MGSPIKKFLVIQTASIGDVILSTPVLEHIHHCEPDSKIDILIKAGYENLFNGHPYIHEVLTWNKNIRKYHNLLILLARIRAAKYDYVFNLQRFASTGFLTAFSGSKITTGFNKNPFSFLFTYSVKHDILTNDYHESKRNLKLTEGIFGSAKVSVKLYPTALDFKNILPFVKEPFICIAPASLWFTKQFPLEKWVEFVDKVPGSLKIILVGSMQDKYLCDRIIKQSGHLNSENLAGKLTLLQTAALFSKSEMNFVNDSAPLHLASAMNAPVSVVFCSTIPAFGFGPLSDDSAIVQTKLSLSCRPCGIHGFSACPEKHFRCAHSIDTSELITRLK